MPQNNRTSVWNGISATGNLSDRFLSGANETVTLGGLAGGSCLGGRAEEFRGRSVLLWTTDQLSAALALIELDGIARRLVLCPADLPFEHLRFVIDSAAVDVVVSDRIAPGPDIPSGVSFIACSPKIVRAHYDHTVERQTEWILLTSGTTGLPKLVVHTLASLAGAIESSGASPSPVVWSTFYDIRRYGGLRIFLRALLSGASLVLSSTEGSLADFMIRAAAYRVTHISGTPSHWRRALMSPSAHRIAPQYVRLSGEIADQAILDHLQVCYPQAKIAHAFASTEAGVAFDVTDGLAGFPAELIGERADVEMKVEDGSLRIRSTLIADRYLGGQAKPLIGADGYVDTGDMLELRGDRYYFVGRRDGVINVGGLKVYPEEVEAVINRHPQVRMSLVRTRKNPITGALVVADVIVQTPPEALNGQAGQLEHEILELCRGILARHKVPAVIRFVSSLPVGATGKIVRQPCVMSS
ncbi:MAG TPA: long-chain fatty acid--CoA ligase [Bryobacteraceae bacterium]|jgi:acyl-coenzyme A synthetase/AMP-(fatty) acid ligase|nr:long-chain fatty acid--CoA ligase [Bryobacteraceae bacterium]